MRALTINNRFVAVLLCCTAAVFAQDNDNNNDQDKVIAAKACECAAKIDGTLPKDKVIEEINSCIRTSKLMADPTAVNKASEEAKARAMILRKSIT